MRGPEVTLHYVTLGHGEPVVMVHGGLEDYRAWTAQLPLLAMHYRAIAYSRRYNFPNRNVTRPAEVYSAQVDADDLAMLNDKLHLVGGGTARRRRFRAGFLPALLDTGGAGARSARAGGSPRDRREILHRQLCPASRGSRRLGTQHTGVGSPDGLRQTFPGAVG